MKKLKFVFYLSFFVLAFSFGAFAQNQITGIVTDAETGNPIPGASVFLKEYSTIGTTTDIDGNYILRNVPADAEVIVFSFVGMVTQEVSIQGRSKIDVALEPSIEEMEEVVVTALGITKEKKALGYSAQGVGGEELAKTGESNVIQSLSAKSAGVQVVSSSGTPGASSKILIRGASSFTTENQPLIVVDGIPIDNSTVQSAPGNYPFNENLQGVNAGNRALDLNPDDIESVTILKGPAAAALYGVRAGNGAILYTTKKGKKGKVEVDYSFEAKFSEVNKLPEFQDQYAGGLWTAPSGAPADYILSQSDATYIGGADFGPNRINELGGGDDVSIGTTYSWGPKFSELPDVTRTRNVDNFFRTGKGYQHNLSISGGTEKTTLRFSFSRLDDEGIIPSTYFDRTTARLAATQEFTDRFKATGTVSYTLSGGNRAQNGSNISGIGLGLFRCPMSFNLNNEEFGYMYPNGQQRMYYFIYDNPYFSANENPFENEVNRFTGSLNMDYVFFDWLTLTYKFGADTYSDEREGAFAIGAMGNNYGEGEVIHNTITNEEFNSDLLIKTNYDFTEDISGNLTMGGNINERNYSNFYSYARQLVLRNFYNLSNGTDQYTSEYRSTIRNSALYFDLALSYQDWLYMGATGRNEWASTFGPNQNSFFYPSANLSVIFTEWIPKNDILTFGKIRYSYAEVGKAPPVYSSRTYYTQPTMTDGFTDGFSFPFLGVNGYSNSTTLGDPDLKPERIKGNEIGLDLRFFNGRINLDLTYYNQKTVDILLNRPIAGSSGFTSVYSNAGEMKNYGYEAIANVDIIKSNSFNWRFTANYSQNESEVLKLAEGVDQVSAESAFTSIGSYAIIGEAYGVFWGTRWARDDQGRLVINPNNGLPLERGQEGGLGSPFPDFQLGLRNTITYKNISLTALLDIREGGDVWYGTGRRLKTYGREKVTEDRESNFVVEGVLAELDGTGNIVVDENGDPVATSTENTIEIAADDYWHAYKGDGGAVENSIEDGSWVRLREIALSYRFNIKKDVLPFGRYVEVSLSGRNLWLDTDYPGVDPETSLTGAGSNIGGFDYFNNPGSKSYSIGIRVGF